jgi:AraC family transcriptional regulator
MSYKRSVRQFNILSRSHGRVFHALDPRSPTGLLAWRLKRALEYIDANLSNRIELVELAQVAGFSRMHFARLFRVSTGVRPHEFVLRRRVDRAKWLLLQSQSSVATIARESGFSTHAHFTNVFRGLVGQPPASWRRANCAVSLSPRPALGGRDSMLSDAFSDASASVGPHS